MELRQCTGDPGSVRITDQVIEEVDEQTTITQQKKAEPHPSVIGLFGPPPPSQPVPVPTMKQS